MNKEELYLKIIDNMNDGVYFVDLDRRITFWNKAAEKITGYTEAEMLGKRCSENLLNHIDSDGKPLCLLSCPLHASIVDGENRKDTVFLKHKKGYRVSVVVKIIPILEDGVSVGAIEIFAPSTASIHENDLIEKLSDVAMKDCLTGLPNRRYLESFIEYRLLEFGRFDKKFAVLFLDIDNFRGFNNEHGHGTGDRVLQNVSASIAGSTRKTDMFGRWGGEEFVGVYQIRKDAEAEVIAEHVRVLVENTLIPHSHPLKVTASIGIAVVQEGDTLESIVQRADEFMYRSKARGRNCVTAEGTGFNAAARCRRQPLLDKVIPFR